LRHVAVIIPARFGAARFPGKPLADLLGKPVICHVVERALEAKGVDRVAVATDDERIGEAARRSGGLALLTGAAASGTDRVAQAARMLDPRPDLVINLQGDEPLIAPQAVTQLVSSAFESGSPMTTLARPLEPGEWTRPQVVKVICDRAGDAIYFSRAPIPFRRAGGESSLARAHVGIYAFTAQFLDQFAALPPSPLEIEESLEQLRALEHGFKIRVVGTSYRGFGIDTPEDLERAAALLTSDGE
jgi:3-deoxy-manno-octulosonate cytidylyltransferase (CMP-KDO synthetase)